MLNAFLLTAAGILTGASAPNEPAVTVPVQAQRFAVRADKLHLGGGRVIEDGTILVEGSKIVAVGGADMKLPEGTRLDVHEGELSAGLIALQDQTGVDGETHDSTRSVLPEAKVAHGIRSESKDFHRLLAAGITTIVISPSPRNLVGGQSAVVKTHGAEVLDDNGHLALTFSSDALDRSRYPTSYSSALSELESHFTEPKGIFSECTSGKLPALMTVKRRQDVANALDFAERFKLKGALHATPIVGELSAQVKAAGLSVVLMPLDWSSTHRELKAVRDLAEAGVPFGFGLNSPQRSAEGLRLSGAMALREGVAPDVVWSALTQNAAKIAGVEQRVGSLAKGRDADFVLWSGSPLDLGSGVRAVYVNGELAWEAETR